jgi:UDP-2-acetamido-2,6-beta-L-arabino-hexul-4-ose reductase
MIETEQVARFADERGFVFEPVEGIDLAQQKNTHVVVSRPGAVRGNHYHLKGTEILVVCGPALIRIREQDKTYDITVEQDETCRLVLPPNVSHAIQNTGSKESLLVAFNSHPHDPDNPDTVRDVLL